jgi:Uma2 family endonuclease
MPPIANDEHQELQTALVTVLQIAIKWAGLGEVRAGVNVSDRKVDWEYNFRCPDVAVFMNATKAENCDTFWFGGPDFAVEIVSENDASRKKLGFYAKVGVRELLVIDRLPWRLELYRLDGDELVSVGTSASTAGELLRSQVIPLSFRLLPGGARPQIEITHHDGVQRWTV